MKLYQRFGITFSLFSFVTLVWNIATPSNPDHLGNLILCGSLTVILYISLLIPEKQSKIVQTASFILAAFTPIHFTGEMFFGAVCIVIGLALMYAYGGYRTHAAWKMPATFAVVFLLLSLSTSAISAESIMRSFVWTAYIVIACFALWLMVDDIERQFHDSIRSSLDSNRKEIDLLKKDIGGRNDATKRA